MSSVSGPEPKPEENAKPPKRYWAAKEPFFDLKASHWVQIILTIVLGFIAFAQYTVYNRQAGIMDKQASIAETQNKISEGDERPWIRPQILTLDPLVITEERITFGVMFKYENSGKYPAFKLAPDFTLVPGDTSGQESFMKKQDAQCKTAEYMSATSLDNITVFPTEPVLVTFSYQINSPIKDFILERGPEKYMIPVLNGCIAYKGVTETMHHTWVSYRITHGGPKPDFLTVEPRTVPVEEIRLGLGPYGRNTAD